MNPSDHLAAVTAAASGVPNSEVVVPVSQDGEQRVVATSAADMCQGTTVALSSVAKYWVLTNLFPGPIPQVSVYGLQAPRLDKDGPQPCLTPVNVGVETMALIQQHQAQAAMPVSAVGVGGMTTLTLPAPQLATVALNPAPAPAHATSVQLQDRSSCETEQCGNNQVHCQVQCDLTLVQQPIVPVSQSITLTPEQHQQLQQQLKNTTKEYQYAQQAMFTRHPDMRFWAKMHPWLTCKLKIQRVMLVDDFGGNKFPNLDLYYKVHPDVCSQANPFLDLPYLF